MGVQMGVRIPKCTSEIFNTLTPSDHRYLFHLSFNILEFHMGVSVQCDTDIRMPHDVLQALWVHSTFCHLGAESVSAYMRRNLGHLNLKNLVILGKNPDKVQQSIHLIYSSSLPSFVSSKSILSKSL